jgi:hypothetical protein
MFDAIRKQVTRIRGMFDPKMALLSTLLNGVVADLSAKPDDATPWAIADRALAATGSSEPELSALLASRDLEALRSACAQWSSGARLLPSCDREVLKRAMTAFRKSLKITRLNDESSLTRNPMTQGRSSRILGMTPPSRYPPAVWSELARQGRLIDAKHGIYELPPE